MTGDSGQASALGPSPVAIHDDGDMFRNLTRFQEAFLELSIVTCCLPQSHSGFSLLKNRCNVAKNLTFFAKKVKENRGNAPQKVTQMS
jgi:hypothetical protein